MMPKHPLLDPLRTIHRNLRDGILAACERLSLTALATVVEDSDGDTLFAIDRIGEELLLPALEPLAAAHGGFVVIAEGIQGGSVTLPHGQSAASCRYRIIIDPIDGTRGLMYQKRPAWILTGVAPNRGEGTRLSDIELAIQTELPLLKQYLCDELWAIRGAGAYAERVNLHDNASTPLRLRPSQAATIEQGYAQISRFFPGARDELAAIDDELVQRLLGASPRGKALCFEDQYASTGGQLYELAVGHDRFIADLRPLLAKLWGERGVPLGLCCHPYDLCTGLIAEESGVILRSPSGAPVDYPLDLDSEVAWVGYANAELARTIAPRLESILALRGWIAKGRED